MKVNRSISKTNEPLEPPCMCSVHMRLEPDKPCLGHGKGCPCTEYVPKPPVVDKAEEAPIQST